MKRVSITIKVPAIILQLVGRLKARPPRELREDDRHVAYIISTDGKPVGGVYFSAPALPNGGQNARSAR